MTEEEINNFQEFLRLCTIDQLIFIAKDEKEKGRLYESTLALIELGYRANRGSVYA